MATRAKTIRHLFDGGWATDFGPTVDTVVGPDGFLRVPFLVEAKNVIYEFDGGPHKIGGTAKLNSSALESGATIRGLYDYWRQGSGGSPAQRRIVHVSTKIYNDDGAGTFSSLFTGLSASAVPSYTTFDDVLIISSDAVTDVPKYWDMTTAKSLGTNTPNFSFAVPHKNRLWAAGVAAAPSTLYYSPDLNASGPDGDWDGATSGTIQIDPGDGDRITGLASYKDELWVFKGPYAGSIHRISGSAPTGSDGFSKRPFIRGLGTVYHNLIFRFRDDLGFVSADGVVHSLTATSAYGDFVEASLSRPIHLWLREHLNNTKLHTGWAANQPVLGRVGIAIPVDAATEPNALLMMDYRFSQIRWSYISDVDATCIAPVVDQAASDRHLFMAGGSDGFVRKLDQETRSIDGTTGISARVKTPHLNYGTPINLKTLYNASVAIAPQGTGDITFGYEMDTNTEETIAITQAGGNILGPSDVNEFTLDDATYGLLGGSRFADRFVDTSGEFRSVSYSFTQAGNNQDMELHGFSATIKRGADSLEN